MPDQTVVPPIPAIKPKRPQNDRDRILGRARYAADPEKFKARARAYREANREKLRQKRLEKYQANPEAARKRSRDDYQKNSQRYKAAASDWNAANPEAKAAIRRNYKARKRKAEGHHTAADIARIKAAQRDRCAYCPRSIRRSFHVDHIKPLSKGGTNWPSNIQLTCDSCNLSKRDADPIEFAQRLGLLI